MSSKKMQLADTEYWYRNVRLTKKKGALKINDETFQVIFEDSYCSTDFSRKGNYFYTGPSDENFGSLDKWRITESTVISLGSTNYKLKEIDPGGMKAVFVIADTDEKLRYHQNDTVRNFTIKLISGNKTSLYDYLGNNKKVLLYFWGTWCAPCRARHPEMNELYRNYQNKLEIFAIANDKKNAVKKYIKENGISWPNAVPDNKFVGELMTKLNVTGYPGYVLLDENGVILMEDAHPHSVAKALEND
jgi:thiol-disulfide isomerase/thioredoxin